MKAATVLSSAFEQVLLFGLKEGHDAHEEMVLILSLPLGQRRFSNQIWAGCEKGPFCVSDSDYLISGGEGYWRFLLFWAIALLLLEHPKLWNKAPQPGLIAYEAWEPCQKQHESLCFILVFFFFSEVWIPCNTKIFGGEMKGKYGTWKADSERD